MFRCMIGAREDRAPAPLRVKVQPWLLKKTREDRFRWSTVERCSKTAAASSGVVRCARGGAIGRRSAAAAAARTAIIRQPCAPIRRRAGRGKGFCAIRPPVSVQYRDAAGAVERMKINPNKCVACGNCTYVCPMGAIYIDPEIKRATIDRNECVECYACFNGLSQEHLPPTMVRMFRKLLAKARLRFEPEPDVCPTAAFEPDELTWPRVVRRAFSDPRVPHESTGVEGRGTEEVKTNDVTGRVGPGEVGFTIELGRPGVGVRFYEIQDMCQTLARAGVAFEKKNPVTSLMSDVPTGTIREDILNEKVLSAIVEIKVPVERTEDIIRLVWDVEKQID